MLTSVIEEFPLPRSDSTSRFFANASVLLYKNGWRLLLSYNTFVCGIDPCKRFHRFWEDYSKTTLAHVASFIEHYNPADAYTSAARGKAWWDTVVSEEGVLSAMERFAISSDAARLMGREGYR